MLSTMTETSTTNTLFVAEDYDFTGYTQEQLLLLCESQLLVKTIYPKLVIMLYFHDKFKSWLSEMSVSLTSKEIIENLIYAVSDYSKDKTEIDIEDNNLWKCIVEPFLLQSLDKEKLNIPRKKKSHTRKKKVKVRFVSI
tara:strand:+ start:431 stop:847 length:417 start_codon:yes stop_codon:yes gene_type:complete